MSNVKQVSIQVTVPWDWASELDPEDCQRIASLVPNPVVGIELSQGVVGYVNNEHGGQTCLVGLSLEGTEALSWAYLNAVVDSLAALPHAQIHAAEGEDIEAGGYCKLGSGK